MCIVLVLIMSCLFLTMSNILFVNLFRNEHKELNSSEVLTLLKLNIDEDLINNFIENKIQKNQRHVILTVGDLWVGEEMPEHLNKFRYLIVVAKIDDVFEWNVEIRDGGKALVYSKKNREFKSRLEKVEIR